MFSARCPKCGRLSDAKGPSDWCSHCVLLLHDPWLTERCPHCHRSVIKDVGQSAGGTPPGTGHWRHTGAMLPYGGPDRAASLIQHFDAGHPIYDLGARADLPTDEYRAVVESFRQRPEVQRILRRVAPQCLPPGLPLTSGEPPTTRRGRTGWRERLERVVRQRRNGTRR
jgi:hypothetical protein